MSHRWPRHGLKRFVGGRPRKLPPGGFTDSFCPTCHELVRIEFDWLGFTMERCRCGVRTLTQYKGRAA